MLHQFLSYFKFFMQGNTDFFSMICMKNPFKRKPNNEL